MNNTNLVKSIEVWMGGLPPRIQRKIISVKYRGVSELEKYYKVADFFTIKQKRTIKAWLRVKHLTWKTYVELVAPEDVSDVIKYMRK